MNNHMPPLSALRAFEAAARHMSFSKAAEELFVTPAAISHQIHALEQDLGVRLFHRLNRSIALTESAQVLLPGL
jgi:LysR family glycine cleavage system transcriptional activator